jgi:hypothetical protein
MGYSAVAVTDQNTLAGGVPFLAGAASCPVIEPTSLKGDGRQEVAITCRLLSGRHRRPEGEDAVGGLLREQPAPCPVPDLPTMYACFSALSPIL